MTGQPMPPMPAHYRAVQIAYAKMISQIQEVIADTRLTPQMALMLAFIGDQETTRTDILRHGYFIGSNLSYPLQQLMGEFLIERLPGPVSSDARRRPMRLTPAGLRLASALRKRLANMPTVAQLPAEASP